jgi:hypothetical protein
MLEVSKHATPGGHQGMLRVNLGSTEVAHAAVFSFVK